MVSDMAQRATVIGVVFSIAFHMAVLAIPFSWKTGQDPLTHFQEVRLSFYHQIKSKPMTSKTKQVKKTKSKTVSHNKRNLVSQKKIFKKPAPVKKTEKNKEVKFNRHTVPVVKNNEKKIEKTTTEDKAPESEKKTEPEEKAVPATKDISLSSKKLDKPEKTNDNNMVATANTHSIGDKTITKTESKTTDEVYRGGFGGNNGPRFLKKVIPHYPRMARKLGKEGKVVLKLFIDKKGRLKKVEVIEDDGYGFAREAVKAIKESTFLPAVRKGVPVDSEALLTVRFRLKD